MSARSRSSLRELSLRRFVIIRHERKGHIDRRRFRGLGVRPRHAKSLGDTALCASPIALCEQPFPAAVVNTAARKRVAFRASGGRPPW